MLLLHFFFLLVLMCLCDATYPYLGRPAFFFWVKHFLEVAPVFVLFTLFLCFLKLFVLCKYLCVIASVILLFLCLSPLKYWFNLLLY